MRREKLKRYLLGYQRPASTGKKAPITSTHKKIEETQKERKVKFFLSSFPLFLCIKISINIFIRFFFFNIYYFFLSILYPHHLKQKEFFRFFYLFVLFFFLSRGGSISILLVSRGCFSWFSLRVKEWQMVDVSCLSFVLFFFFSPCHISSSPSCDCRPQSTSGPPFSNNNRNNNKIPIPKTTTTTRGLYTTLSLVDGRTADAAIFVFVHGEGCGWLQECVCAQYNWQRVLEQRRRIIKRVETRVKKEKKKERRDSRALASKTFGRRRRNKSISLSLFFSRKGRKSLQTHPQNPEQPKHTHTTITDNFPNPTNFV